MRETLNPKIALVGLSPASTQIDAFTRHYARNGDYGGASVAGAFAGLDADILAMLKGLGLSQKLGLDPSLNTLRYHPDIYVTSLVACASLTTSGSSDDFDPQAYPAAMRCITQRLVSELSDPRWSQLSTIIVFGSKGWDAFRSLRTTSGATLLDDLANRGLTVLKLPHPSGQNKEYVQLAASHNPDP